MSLPDLPDIFGNYALGDFNEVVSPPAIDWLPQTPGWYVVGVLVLAWLGRLSWLKLRHWYRNRYRREAAAHLQGLTLSPDSLGDMNQTLKLSALVAFPRQEVAALSGEHWTAFLNAQCEQPPFSVTQCQMLSQGVYQQQSLDPVSGEQLRQACLAWVSQHKNRYDD